MKKLIKKIKLASCSSHCSLIQMSTATMLRRPFYSSSKQHGFTLIEVMLVIVIMAIMAALIVMNLHGTEQRKVMQAREFLSLDLQKIGLEANDQGRVLGLVVLPATAMQPTAYQVLEYVPKPPDPEQAQQPIQQTQYIWQVAKDFQTKHLPDQSSLLIQSLDPDRNVDALKPQSQNIKRPDLIWLGNGEVLPARLQLYLQQQSIGEAIEINRLGQVVQVGGS